MKTRRILSTFGLAALSVTPLAGTAQAIQFPDFRHLCEYSCGCDFEPGSNITAHVDLNSSLGIRQVGNILVN